MTKTNESANILIADDDPDDCLMAENALREFRQNNGLYFVEDGEELLEYLRHQGKYAERSQFPKPDLILLDLNMPRKDGREALAEIKADPELRRIPVVVLTTSRAEEDIARTYDLGVNSFITKPVTFQGLTEALKMVTTYWLELVKRPNRLTNV